MAELFAAFLEMITPKSKVGKYIWGFFAVLVLLVGVMELLGALGY